MANQYVTRYNIFTGQSWFITSFPDVRYVANAEYNYNAEYGVNDLYYPAPYAGHKGTDYGTPTGTPLHGLDGFTIVSINHMSSGLGNHIEIANSKISFILAHLDSINVSEGQEVDSGTLLGYTGNTGYSQGPHLHVQCWLAGTGWVDATPYVNGNWGMPTDVAPTPPQTILPNKSMAILDGNTFVGVVESGMDGNAVVTRILFADGRTEVVYADRLKGYPFAELNRIVGLDGSMDKIGQIIEYGQDHQGTVARVRYADNTSDVVYAFRLIPHLPNFVQGDIANVEGIGQMQIETHAFDGNGDKVYRVSTVVYANRVRPV